MAKKIYVATPTRGFLNQLFNFNNDCLRFVNTTQEYEVISNNKILLHRIAKSKIIDKIGFIHKMRTGNLNDSIDYVFSYNKFVETNKPYYIYLENPYALANYSMDRPSYALSKKNLRKSFLDKNLKGIICASQACRNTIEEIYDIPDSLDIEQIYPLIKNADLPLAKILTEKESPNINCLFISSRFDVKGGREVLELFEEFKKNNVNNITLTIVTVIDELNDNTLRTINNNQNIHLLNFDLESNEMSNLYLQHDVLLNPTRMDSFSLVTLEAMKYGNAIVTSDLYALPEMVCEGKNGYLMSPKFRFYGYDNLANREVWNHREETIFSNYIDWNLVSVMYEKITYLLSNKNKLRELQTESYLRANKYEFNDKRLFDKWLKIFN